MFVVVAVAVDGGVVKAAARCLSVDWRYWPDSASVELKVVLSTSTLIHSYNTVELFIDKTLVKKIVEHNLRTPLKKLLFLQASYP